MLATKRSSRPRTQHSTPVVSPPTDTDKDRDTVAVAAYYLAEKRGFKPGRELEDWLEAERQLNLFPIGQ